MTRAKMPIVSGAGSWGDPHHQFGFSFDQRRCTGCKTCEMACRDYHDLGAGARLSALCTSMRGEPGSKTTRARGNTTCSPSTSPCPATIARIPSACAFAPPMPLPRTISGCVRVDAARCTGCQVCALSCPYHAPRFSEASAHIEKCDGCFDRVAAGLGPICVEACPPAGLGTSASTTTSPIIRSWSSVWPRCPIRS